MQGGQTKSDRGHAARVALCASLATWMIAAAVAPVTAGASPPTPAPLPPAETRVESGVEPILADLRGDVRILVTLTDQPLLEAAARRANASRLLTDTQVVNGGDAAVPRRITAPERAAARRAERRYERAVDLLQSPADIAEVSVDALARSLKGLGGDIVDTQLVPAAVEIRIASDKLDAVAELPAVQAVSAAAAERPLSGIGWQVVGAPAWFGAGHTGGTGASDTVQADAGVASELPDPTHPAFSDAVVENDPAIVFGPTNHGTHTAGVIASSDATYRGVSYGVDHLVNGDQPFQLGFEFNGIPGATDPAEVINTSFGSSQIDDNGGDGDDITTAFFGVSQALSAGNEHVTPNGPPTVQNMGRNTMSVGGFNDIATPSTADDVVLGISSRGPTPSGRKKPDLTAPGGSVVSADSAWNTPPGNPDYTAATGTSFSSPHVAGAMALLEGAGITDPMAQRAILINSAHDWDGTNTGLRGWTAPQTGWRPEVGWGVLDLTTALAQRTYHDLGSVEEGEAAFYRATVPAGSKATMAFQLRGFFEGYPGPPFPAQTLKYTQSDLDLHQYDSADAEVSPAPAFDSPDTTIDPGPDAQDPNDTVEQVRSPASPGTQTVTYKVQSASTIDGAESEPFAIAAAAPLTELAAPTVKPGGLDASLNEVRCGQPVTITAAARNDSADLAATDSALTIDLPTGVELTAGAPSQAVSGGTLEASTTSENRTWTIEATTGGSKVIAVNGAGDAYGTTFNDHGEVTVTADCSPPVTEIDSGPSGPTSDATPSFAFSAQGGAVAFECSLDGASFAECTSPLLSEVLNDGQHSFSVRARDAVGNVDPSPPTRTFTVDTEVRGAALSADRKQRFRGKAIRVRVALAERGSILVEASAKVKAGKVALTMPDVVAGPGGATLSTRLVASRSAARAIRAALRRRPVKAVIHARFSDALGNLEVKSVTIKLRR